MVTAPTSSLEPDRVDADLVQQLNQMSFQERERIHEEIHGVQSLAVQETPEFLEQKLAELDRALEYLPEKEKVAYSEAIRFGSMYVNDNEKLRIPMLRAEVFDVKKAAIRLCKFFDLAKDLHGNAALMRPVGVQDFNTEDTKLLKRGIFQALPGRDRTGRRVMGHFVDIPPEFSVRSRIKNVLYMYTTLAEDEETQKKGCVFIVFHPSPSTQVCASAEERDFVQRMMASIPVRVSAIHVCLHDDMISRMIKTVFLVAIGPEGRTRTKIKNKTHLKWIELRQVKERAVASGQQFQGIECPSLNDLLFGKGRPIMRHPGNVLLRSMLESKYNEYNNTKGKKEKTEIAWSIVRQLQESSCRFLKEDGSGYWVEVTPDIARQKISVGFRDLRKTIAPENVRPSNTTSCSAGVKRKEDVDSSTSVFLAMDGQMKRQRCLSSGQATR
ncbi:MAG: hypothetical protein SGILL_005027 [Bacillariaceae sp.]